MLPLTSCLANTAILDSARQKKVSLLSTCGQVTVFGPVNGNVLGSEICVAQSVPAGLIVSVGPLPR